MSYGDIYAAISLQQGQDDAKEKYVFEKVEEVYGLTKKHILSNSKLSNMVHVRWITYYLLNVAVKLPIAEIARRCKKSYNTVQYGIEAVTDALHNQFDPRITDKLKEIKKHFPI